MSRVSVKAMVAALSLMFVLGSAYAGGERIAVAMDEPFEFEGELYPAGSVSLEVVREFSPSTNLNEVRASGNSLGLLVTKRRATETPADTDSVLFARDSEGHLVLIGYTLRGESYTHLFR